MDAWLIWIIISAVLIIVEILSQQVWTICLAIGGIAAMVGALCGLNPLSQICLMAAVGVIAFIALMPLFRRWHNASDSKEGRDARTGMDALLGRHAIVTQEIRPGHIGRARIDGDFWQVKAPHSADVIPRGAEVVVIAYDSIILTVNKL